MKVEFTYSTGYCGMDETKVVEFPEATTDKELDAYAWEGAIDNAESYGIYPYPDYEVEEDEEGDQYSDNIEGYWVKL